MRIFKSHPLLKLANSYLIDSAQPSNLSYLWNFGSLLGFCLVIQIITGVTLAMHYNPSVLEAFNSVEHIMRDVNNGWLIRYLHSNTASAFFFLVYLHMGRGLYYGSYRAPRTLVWTIGTVIFILMVATAFLGYKYKRSPKWYYIMYNKYCISNKYFLCQRDNKLSYNLLGITCKRYYSSINTTIYEKTSEKLSDIKELNLEPLFVFENLKSENTRQNIRTKTKGLSGIYMILNKITKDYYIGSASTNRLNARFINHLIQFKGSKVVKAAVKKYGLENFSFIILELYPNIVNKDNNKELLDLEDKYLKTFLPNYNILTEAGSMFGYKHTNITRKKLKDIHNDPLFRKAFSQKLKDVYTEERKIRVGKLNLGKKFSTETIEKMRKKALERPSMSEETRKKCITNTKAVVLYNLNRTVYGKFTTILEAAKSINCNEKTIRRALKTEKKLVKRQWIVKYL